MIAVRCVLHGQVWLEFPETVVSDDGTVLATVQLDGSPMVHHPEHPFGPHPWSYAHAWTGPTVLKLRRTTDWYSVWKFFDPVAEGWSWRHWYVNFERPVVRRPDGVDVDDLQLDLIIHPDGTRRWKDVEHLGPALSGGRSDVDGLTHVLDAAATVTELLDADDRWWSCWDDWTPAADADLFWPEPNRGDRHG